MYTVLRKFDDANRVIQKHGNSSLGEMAAIDPTLLVK